MENGILNCEEPILQTGGERNAALIMVAYQLGYLFTPNHQYKKAKNIGRKKA